MAKPALPSEAPNSLPDLGPLPDLAIMSKSGADKGLGEEIAGPNGNFDVPSMAELGVKEPNHKSIHKGGETEALRRFEEFMKQKARVAKVHTYIVNHESSFLTSGNSLRNHLRLLQPLIQHLQPACLRTLNLGVWGSASFTTSSWRFTRSFPATANPPFRFLDKFTGVKCITRQHLAPQTLRV